MESPRSLRDFHPAVVEWFTRTFPNGPSDAQSLGWTSIASGDDTLIAAPTGSGKTLAAFLVAIDRSLRKALGANPQERATSVVYVSPLRALTVDIKENLERPLREIAEICVERGYGDPKISVAVRNGDTTQAARAAIVRNRPQIVVTTPESLYLLLTAARGREVLATVETIIVDEIHALARDKRGAHLALSLERLDRVVTAHGGLRPTRIGCSATQRPIEAIARLLVGVNDKEPAQRRACRIVDLGHERALDLAITLGDEELGAVMTNDYLDWIISSIAQLIETHRETLIFVNTRRMAERIAHLLAELLGDGAVAAHHGSLSVERRLAVEERLRSGELRAVVATASLELGIDVGPIDLVCQIGSPRSIATFLQRVGRAEHRRDGIPKGRVYPGTRDELVECAALFAAVKAHRLDAIEPPRAPLDILAQQIVAECAGSGEDGLAETELEALIRRAAPFAEISPGTYESVVELVSEGVETGRGRRGAHVHRDVVNGVLRPRRGARLTASTSGGAIPELADYRVILEPEGVLIGTVHEDFAVEAMAGDVFLLGSNSWRVHHVEQGTVRVFDASGAAPTLPFWLGEAPARTNELASLVSELREVVEGALREKGGVRSAHDALVAFTGIDDRAAKEIIAYLAAAFAELGVLPTQSRIVFERFFDETGGMQLVVHSPFGARINRGLGLALRKRFCRSFDFELQAAASDDAIVLSLGPQHSFALEEVRSYLSPATVEEVLVQAVLATPIFASRWRWNLGRSLVSPRFRGARHLPPAIQRMEADDLMATIFPALAACQENANGPIEIPDHPIVTQTIHDCMTEAMDLDGLVNLVGALRSGTLAASFIDTSEPSVLSHEILNGRPYTFLDDAPLEERRTRAVALRRGLPLESRDLSRLDPELVEEVGRELAIEPADVEELHDLLLVTGITPEKHHLLPIYDVLEQTGRALRVTRSNVDAVFWCATERRSIIEAVFPDAVFTPDSRLDRDAREASLERSDALARILGGWLEVRAVTTNDALVNGIGGISDADVTSAIALLEAKGTVFRLGDGRFGTRRVLARIHARQRDRERRSYSAVSVQDLMCFYLRWQHAAPGHKRTGQAGLLEVIDQLGGIEVAAGAWEESVLPARVTGYAAHLIDDLAASGEISWARLSLRNETKNERLRRAGSSPSAATPITIARREVLDVLTAAARMGETPTAPPPGAAAEILEVLEARGALFFADLCASTQRLPLEVAEAIWDGVSRGLLTADGFNAVRVLLSGRYRRVASNNAFSASSTVRAIRPRQLSAHRRGRALPPALAGGRWSLVAAATPDDFEPDELAESVALTLLNRWGVVVRELIGRESLSISWREILWALRRLEARGVARGGRFVAGLVGEQFALPKALDELRLTARSPKEGNVVVLSAADPLNLTGIILPGPRISSTKSRRIELVDGLIGDPKIAPSSDELISSAS